MSAGNKLVTKSHMDSELRKIWRAIAGARATQHTLSGIDEKYISPEVPDNATHIWLPSFYRVNPYYTDGVYGNMEEYKYHAGTGAGGGHYYWYRCFARFNIAPLFGRVLTTCELKWLLCSTAIAGSGVNAQLDLTLQGITDYGEPEPSIWDIATLTPYGPVNVYDDTDGTVYSKDVKTWIQSLIDARTSYACFRFKGNLAEPILNGGFASATTSWGGVDCTLASVAGGESGNCLEITRTGGTEQYAWQTVANLIIGEQYVFTVYVKSGTSGNEEYEILLRRTSDSGDPHNSVGTTSGTWTAVPITFTATAASYTFYLQKNTSTAGTMLFDTVTLVGEVTEPADASNANNYRLTEVLLYAEC